MVQFGLNDFGQPHYGPKYVEGSGNPFGVVRYSRVSHALVLVDADQAFLDSLAANQDVLRLATMAQLDNPITVNQRNNFRNRLENNEIPAQWVNTGDTRRQIIRGLAGVFRFAQRVEARTGTGLRESFQQFGITLDTTWSALPQGAKNVINETADDFGWTNPGFTGATELRAILKFMSDQFENSELIIRNTSI